jgi:hypothetical protein
LDEDDVDQPWNYHLIYRERTFPEVAKAGHRGYVIMRVASDKNLFAVWLETSGIHLYLSPGTVESKTCPDCAEDVLYAARKCRFCGYRFTDAPTES